MLSFLEQHKIKTVYLPLIIYWLLLILGTSLPSKSVPNFNVNDKVEHLFAYLILALLFNLTLLFQDKFKILKTKAASSTIIILGIYALMDELHQLFIPGRYCDVWDWTADFIGVILAVLLIQILKKIKDRKK